jgi:hypothetical protein
MYRDVFFMSIPNILKKLMNINNKIQYDIKMSILKICTYCDKKYEFKDLYDKHIDVCQFLSRNRKERHHDIESIEKLPSEQEMFALVQNLSMQCKILTNEINRLKSNNCYRIKRNSIDYLKKASIPPILFEDWIRNFPMKMNHLEEVFSSGLSNGIKKCINERIFSEGLDNIPIRAFKEKKGAIYIYTKDTKWEICANDDIIQIIYNLSQGFSSLFCTWKDLNSTIDDEIKLDYICKLFGTKINKEKQKSDIKSFIYSQIQMSFYHI